MACYIMCGLIPVVECQCYCTRPLPAASAYPSHPCIVSKIPFAWKLLCDFVSRPGHSSADGKWSSEPAPLATSSLTP